MANNPRHLRPPLLSLYDVLDFYAQKKKDKNQTVMCLQVGANDGKNNDPVHKYFRDFNWKGILVEPQYDVFHEGLTKTYAGNKNVILENVALATSEGELPFYRVAISKARWATGLSSFDKKSLQGHIDNGYIIRKAREEGVEIPTDISKLIEVVKVPTMTVQKLLSKHNVDQLQVLCVDTEGYDFEILKLIDVEKYDCQLILFESKNLSNNDFVAAKQLLTNAGYRLFWEKGDTLAINFELPKFLELKLKLKALIRKI